MDLFEDYSDIELMSLADKYDTTSTGAIASTFDREFFIQQNKMRTNPKSFIPILEDYIKRFDSTGYIVSRDGKPRLRTQEGVAAVREAIEFLKTQAPVPALVWNHKLAQAAKDHVNAQGPTGQTGHNDPDGTTMVQRVQKYGTYRMVSENIHYGDSDPMWAMLMLVIDDGVPSRGHRVNMFRSALEQTGCGTGPHTRYGQMTNCDYAQSFVSNGRLMDLLI